MLKNILITTLVALTLSGCYCKPEGKDSVDSNYFDNCWGTFKNGPSKPIIFPKDAL